MYVDNSFCPVLVIGQKVELPEEGNARDICCTRKTDKFKMSISQCPQKQAHKEHFGRAVSKYLPISVQRFGVPWKSVRNFSKARR